MRRVLIAAVFATVPRVCSAITPFVPNDPYFYPHPSGNPSFSQGYLDKTGTAWTVDINIRSAWNHGLTGQGITVGVVDGGVQYTHPDLAANYDAAKSYDYYQYDSDPSPETSVITDAHGTAIAGLIAASGGNGIGVTGIAPDAKFASLRILPPDLYGSFTDASYRQRMLSALTFQPSTGRIDIKNFSIAESGAFGVLRVPELPPIELALQQQVQAGLIFVQGSGNWRQEHGVVQGREGDSNRKLFSHLPETIVVGAVGADGHYAPYSNFGSCLTVCAPSGMTGASAASGTRLMTTDLVGSAGFNSGYGDTFQDRDYTSRASGTSFSGPVVSGVLALAKQANPALTTRMAKHLFARTSIQVDAANQSWCTNAAGYHFSNDYGFGLVDASSTVQLADRCIGVSALTAATTGQISAGDTRIPIGTATGVTRNVHVGSLGALEEVQVSLQINGPGFATYGGTNYSALGGVITSPSGTTSTFMLANAASYAIVSASTAELLTMSWTFVSNAFWGEVPNGTWTVSISHPYPDQGGDSIYTWNSFELVLRSGSLIEALPGDATRDGIVDSTDLNVFSANYGLTGSARWIHGDFDADGKVITTDFNLLAGNFGVSSASLGANVPEPAMLSLLLPMLLRRRSR